MYARSSRRTRRLVPFIGQFLLVAALAAEVRALEPVAGGSGRMPSGGPCLDDARRAALWRRTETVIAALAAQGISASALAAERAESGSVTFAWPVRAANGLLDPGFHGVGAHVDHDPSYPDQLRDYSCGPRTYDVATGYNHRGTDVYTWPYPWLRMDLDQVEVIAAAPGIIVQREDGHFDRRCGCESDDPNLVFVQHADGSIAWYLHLKSGSVTPKQVGQTVAAGERLGVVGSSGCSSGPHLHFEVYDGAQLIDPYDGSCNGFNTESWWADQHQYDDSALNALATHWRLPDPFPACPQTEDPAWRNAFLPGDTAWFAAYYRDQLGGQVSDYAVLAPDGSTFASWSHASAEPYFASSWWAWQLDLPSDAPVGRWSFVVTFEGQSHVHRFSVGTLFADGFESGSTTAWSGGT